MIEGIIVRYEMKRKWSELELSSKYHEDNKEPKHEYSSPNEKRFKMNPAARQN